MKMNRSCAECLAVLCENGRIEFTLTNHKVNQGIAERLRASLDANEDRDCGPHRVVIMREIRIK